MKLLLRTVIILLVAMLMEVHAVFHPKTKQCSFRYKVVTTSMSFHSQISWDTTVTSFTMFDCVVYCLDQYLYTYQMVLDGDGNCGCITDCWFSPPAGPNETQFYVMSPIIKGEYTGKIIIIIAYLLK